MVIEKSYNPFKMWGSYVGVLIGIAYGLFQHAMANTIYQDNFWLQFSFKVHSFSDMFPSYPHILGTLFFVCFTVIVGFLLGYGIHSLIRKYKK